MTWEGGCQQPDSVCSCSLHWLKPSHCASNPYPCHGCYHLLVVTAVFPAAFWYHISLPAPKAMFPWYQFTNCSITQGHCQRKQLVWLSLMLADSQWLLLITLLLMRWLQIECLNSCFNIFPHLSNSFIIIIIYSGSVHVTGRTFIPLHCNHPLLHAWIIKIT